MQRADSPSIRKYDATCRLVAGILLALMPLLSFAGQYFFSLRDGTQGLMLRHLTVTVVDWVFVPFNFFVVREIDWSRGGRLYALFCVSTALTVAAHANWQLHGLDLGHMITKTGVVLPAGWLHLVFSILEMTLLTAFVFCRNESIASPGPATIFAVVYFLALGICGYIMHRGLIASDAIASGSGLFFILIYPRFIRTHFIQ